MRLTLLSLGVATLLACTSTAPRYEADPGVDFAPLKRFAWQAAPRTDAPAHPLDSEILEKRIRASAVATLTGRGFSVDEQAPQFRLRSRVVVAAKAKPAPRLSVGFGVGSIGGHSASSVSVGGSTAVGEAGDALTLALEVRDPVTGELMWQGWREVDEGIGDAGDPALDAAVRAILADFPSPPKNPPKKPAKKKR